MLTVIIFTFTSCKDAAKEKELSDGGSCSQEMNADSMMNLWNHAFEAKDTMALRNMFAEDAIIISNDEKVISRDSIMKKWIMFGQEETISCKTQKVYTCECCCCISYTGTFDFTVTAKGKSDNEKGTFTLVWKTQKDKAWKVELFHYEPAPRPAGNIKK